MAPRRKSQPKLTPITTIALSSAVHPKLVRSDLFRNAVTVANEFQAQCADLNAALRDAAHLLHEEYGKEITASVKLQDLEDEELLFDMGALYVIRKKPWSRTPLLSAPLEYRSWAAHALTSLNEALRRVQR